MALDSLHLVVSNGLSRSLVARVELTETGVACYTRGIYRPAVITRLHELLPRYEDFNRVSVFSK